MDDLKLAKEKVARLEDDLAKAIGRKTELETERRRVAFAAKAGGSKDARKALDAATAASVTAELEIENFRSALEEGKRRVSEAERKAALVARRANAEQVKKIATRVEKRGPAFAIALSALCEEFAALEADLRAMRELGAEIVPARLVALGFSNAISQAGRTVGLELGDTVPPAQRHEPKSLTDGYARRANEWAATVLGEKEAA